MTESDKHFASILLLHLPAMVSAATNCAGVRLCASVCVSGKMQSTER